MIDAKAFGVELAAIVQRATAPLQQLIEAQAARIADLEKAIAAMPAPQDGAPGRDGADGASVTLGDVLPDLQKQVDEFLAAVPLPQDGKDGAPGRDGVDGAPGADGASVTADDVLPVIGKRVDEYLAALPVPQDGKDGAPGRDGADGAPGADGADGVSLAGAMIDRKGALVVTLSNGTLHELGIVVGKDGDRGADGRDGLGFEDLEFEPDADGRLWAKFSRGGIVKRALIPGILYRGVYKSADGYLKGDAVTYGGGIWIAMQDSPDGRPDGGPGWQLANKRGKDGRDGKDAGSANA